MRVDAADELLRQLGALGFVKFHPALGERLGFKAAIFLGHALYWSRHLAKEHPRRGGWLYMTSRQWQQATGLTAKEQLAIREQLVRHQLLAERLSGRPARMHYRVDLARLADWAGLHGDANGGAGTQITWEMFSPWLKGAVSFYKPLSDACGSVAGGLYLSWLLRQQRTAMLMGTATLEGFFHVSHQQARIALCLGTKTQRNVRDKLRSLGLLHERGSGLCRLDLDSLGAALDRVQTQDLPVRPIGATKQIGTSKPSDADAQEAINWLAAAGRRHLGEPVRTKHLTQEQRQLSLLDRWLTDTHQGQGVTSGVIRMFMSSASAGQDEEEASVPAIHDGLGESEHAADGRCQSLALLSKLEPGLVLTKGQAPALLSHQTGPFVATHLPFCRTHIQVQNNISTTTARVPERARAERLPSRRRIPEKVQTDAQQAMRADPLGSAVGQNPEPCIELPKALPEHWHQSVLRTLASVDVGIRQALLDELEGQLGISGKTIHNPPGYLHALIRRHRSGSLDLAMADKVASDRQQRKRTQEAIERAMVDAPTGKATPVESSGNGAAVATEPSAAQVEAREKLRALRRQFAGRRQGT